MRASATICRICPETREPWRRSFRTTSRSGGTNRERVFFSAADRVLYLRLVEENLREACARVLFHRRWAAPKQLPKRAFAATVGGASVPGTKF